MLSSVVESFTDPDEYAAAIPANVELTITTRGTFSARLTRVHLHRLQVQRVYDNLPRVRHSVYDPGTAVFAFRPSTEATLIRNSREIRPTEIIRGAEAEDCYHRSWGPTSVAAMWLPVEDMVTIGSTVAACDLSPPREGMVVTPPPVALARLRRLHAAATQLAEDAPEIVANKDAARGLEQTLIEAMAVCLGPQERTTDNAARGQHAIVMRRFHTILAENADQPLYVPEICKAIKISERTLRICCQEYLGMGPSHYLVLRRMNMAARALRTSSASCTTVADIATQYGFWQLGRFAVEYRTLFGESPSATLRQ